MEKKITGNQRLTLYLLGIYSIAVGMRMVPQIVAGPKLPFWDSAAFYKETIQLLSTGTVPYYFPGLYFLYGFISLLAGASDPYWLCKYLPPIVNALTIFPFYLLGKAVTGKRQIGLLSALLFAIVDIGALRQSYYISEGIALFFIPLMYFLLVQGSRVHKGSWVYSTLSPLFFFITLLYHFPTGLIAVVPVLFYSFLCLIRLKLPSKPFLILSSISILGSTVFVTYSTVAQQYLRQYVLGQTWGVLLMFERMPSLSFENFVSGSLALSKNSYLMVSMMGSLIFILSSLAIMLSFLIERIKWRKTGPLLRRRLLKRRSVIKEAWENKNLFLFAWFFITSVIFGISLLIDFGFGSEALKSIGFWIYPYRALVYLIISTVIPMALALYGFYMKHKKPRVIIIIILGMIFVSSILFEIMMTNIYLPTSYGPK